MEEFLSETDFPPISWKVSSLIDNPLSGVDKPLHASLRQQKRAPGIGNWKVHTPD